MFYSQDILCRKGGKFTLIWIEATGVLKLTRRQLLEVNIRRACHDIGRIVRSQASPPRPGAKRPHFSLYLSAQLMYGTVRIYGKQVHFLLTDAAEFENRVYHEMVMRERQAVKEAKDPKKKKHRDEREKYQEEMEGLPTGTITLSHIPRADQVTLPDPIVEAAKIRHPFTYSLPTDWDYTMEMFAKDQWVSSPAVSPSLQEELSQLRSPAVTAVDFVQPEYGTPLSARSREEITIPDREPLHHTPPDVPIEGEKDLALFEGELEMIPEELLSGEGGSQSDEVATIPPPTAEPDTYVLPPREVTPTKRPEAGERRPGERKKRKSRGEEKETPPVSPKTPRLDQAAAAADLVSPTAARTVDQLALSPIGAAPVTEPGIEQAGRPADQAQVAQAAPAEESSLELMPVQGVPPKRRVRRQLFVDVRIQLSRDDLKKNLATGHTTSVRRPLPDPQPSQTALELLRRPGNSKFRRSKTLTRLWDRNCIESSTDTASERERQKKFWTLPEGDPTDLRYGGLQPVFRSPPQEERTSSQEEEKRAVMDQHTPTVFEESVVQRRAELSSIEIAREPSMSKSLTPRTEASISHDLSRKSSKSLDESSISRKSGAEIPELREEGLERSRVEGSMELHVVPEELSGMYSPQVSSVRDRSSVSSEELTPRSKLLRLCENAMVDKPYTTFRSICPPATKKRTQAVSQFTALLELCSKGTLFVKQRRPYHNIYIARASFDLPTDEECDSIGSDSPPGTLRAEY